MARHVQDDLSATRSAIPSPGRFADGSRKSLRPHQAASASSGEPRILVSTPQRHRATHLRASSPKRRGSSLNGWTDGMRPHQHDHVHSLLGRQWATGGTGSLLPHPSQPVERSTVEFVTRFVVWIHTGLLVLAVQVGAVRARLLAASVAPALAWRTGRDRRRLRHDWILVSIVEGRNGRLNAPPTARALQSLPRAPPRLRVPLAALGAPPAEARPLVLAAPPGAVDAAAPGVVPATDVVAGRQEPVHPPRDGRAAQAAGIVAVAVRLGVVALPAARRVVPRHPLPRAVDAAVPGPAAVVRVHRGRCADGGRFLPHVLCVCVGRPSPS